MFWLIFFTYNPNMVSAFYSNSNILITVTFIGYWKFDVKS